MGWNMSKDTSQRFDIRCVIAALFIMLGSHGACYAANSANSGECVLTPREWWGVFVDVLTVADSVVPAPADVEALAGSGSGSGDQNP